MGSSSSSSKVARFGAFAIDLHTGELSKHGVRLRLPEQPRQILCILLEQNGRMVTREELCRQLWPGNTFVDFDHSLNTAVMRLREVLSDSSDNPRFIETLPRRGYRFIAPVEQGSDLELENHLPNAQAATAASNTKRSQPPSQTITAAISPTLPPDKRSWPEHRVALGASAFLAISAIVFFAYTFLGLRAPRHTSGAAKQITSLVVLPLENLSEDKDQQYFADGMTDELIANLAKIHSLRVISRTSAMEYKGLHKSLSEIARDLSVDAVVEGTVLRSGNRVRITAELEQVDTDRHLWADTYESQLDDVLSLQSRVATAIVDQIRINLTPEEHQRLGTARPVSPESYEDYLKGRYYWNKRSEESLERAIEYFQSATQKDPKSALAFAGLADCYSIIGSAIIGTVPSQEVAAKAKASAIKALDLDPSLAEAQTSLATVQFNYDWDWAAAGNGFRRSLELNPNYATAYQRYSLYLIAMGRTDESLAQMNRARSLDPMSVSVNFSLGWRLYMAHQYDQAIQQLRNTLEMDPSFALARMVLGQAYEQKGSYPQAIAELQQAATVSHDSPPMLGALGYALGVAGKRGDAVKILSHLLEESKTRYVSPFYVAIVYTGLNDNEKALDWLEKAYTDRSNALIFLKAEPELDGLRANPRFESLKHRLAL